ncbi:MAG: DUF3168 domain-containing protein [Clostridia bacterium]|nr:DUF3168 domain-containing protein [Clostridia bacterium]
MKNFKIGKELVTILSGSSDVADALGNKIFPLIAVPNTTFPFMVYRRSYYTPASNKDYEGEKVGVELVIAATKYEDGVDIADKVATAINHARTTMIDDVIITNIKEDFIEDTFTQQINLEVTLRDETE